MLEHDVNLKYFVTKIVKYTLSVLVFISIFLVLSLNYFDSSKSNDINTYSTIVTRLSIFYLGSIITMSVYIYTKRYSMSTIQFSSPITSVVMGIGVVCSFLSMLLLPNKLYDFSNLEKITSLDINILNLFIKSIYYFFSLFVMDGEIFKFLIVNHLYFFIIKIFSVSFNYQMVVSFLNLLFFTIATFIFVVTLWKFITSFHIDSILKKNYIEVVRIVKVNDSRENLKFKESMNNSLTRKDMKKLLKSLDVYNQNLLYLLTLKNEKLTEKYFSKWEIIIIAVQNRLFQSPIETKLSKELYLKTLDLTNQLIIETSDHISLKLYNDSLLTTIFNSIPFLNDEEVDEEVDKKIDEENLAQIRELYSENYENLSSVCYIELKKIIEYLYKKDNQNNILYKMLSGEIRFLESTVFQSGFRNEWLDVNGENSNYIEDLLIGMLFNVINANNNSDLPIILALLFKTQSLIEVDLDSDPNEESSDSPSTTEILGNLKEIIKVNMIDKPSNEDSAFEQPSINPYQKSLEYSLENINLSHKSITFLIIAIIKANEIENYKAVGYLIKRLCNHLTYKEILIKMDLIEQKMYGNEYRDLLLSNISLNDYSLRYCFNKTKVLLALQKGFSGSEEKSDVLRDLSKINNFEEILNALKDKHKEFNLYYLKSETINEYIK